MQISLHAKRKDKNVRFYKCSTHLCQKNVFQYILMSCSLKVLGTFFMISLKYAGLPLYLFSCYCYICKKNALLVPQMPKFLQKCMSYFFKQLCDSSKHHQLCCCRSYFAFNKDHALLIIIDIYLSWRHSITHLHSFCSASKSLQWQEQIPGCFKLMERQHSEIQERSWQIFFLPQLRNIPWNVMEKFFLLLNIMQCYENCWLCMI